MNDHLSNLPDSAFIKPDGSNREQVDALVRKAWSEILDWSATAQSRPPMPAYGPLPQIADIPDEPLPEDQVIRILRRLMDGSMNPAHPGYIGHMDPLPSTASIIGALATGALNNNMLSLELSPQLSRLEERLMAGLAQLFGLGPKSGGLMLSGGSLANLQALAVARNHHFKPMASGLVGLSRQPVLFVSSAAHTSFHKAAMLLGLGTDAVIEVETDANSRMIPQKLEEAILRARGQGQAPFFVAAIAGTTVTGSVDPLIEVGQVAQKEGLWYHVDAAYGGAMVMSDKEKTRLEGIGLADSLTFNPQKWLYVTKVCATLMFKDMGVLERDFRVQLPYMQNPEGFINYGEVSVQGTRHPDVLKLWLTLQHLGRKGLGEMVEQTLALTHHLLELVEARPSLKLAARPETNIVVFRAEPSWIPPHQWDDLNTTLQGFLLERGQVFFAVSRYQGKRWLRAVLGNPFTTPQTLRQAMETVDDFMRMSREAVTAAGL